MTHTSKKKIVILGGGFAGIYGARSVRKACGDMVEITIVSRANYFLFTPMLHEVATGGLGHHQVVESVRGIMASGARFFEAEAQSVDLSAKEVVTDRGRLPYDILVLALGATTNFFGTPGAEEHSLVLKDLSDAIRMRNRVIDCFEHAAHERAEAARKKLLSFAVVGGGATGVELAAELIAFAKKTLARSYRSEFPCSDVTVTLVNSGHELLAPFSAKTRAYALKSLTKKGIKILLDTKAAEVSAEGIKLGDGSMLTAGTVMWAAGVKANQIATAGGTLPLEKSGRITAEPSLLVQGFSDIYALGDTANVPSKDGTPYPMLAQVAEMEAKHLGPNIARALAGEEQKPFVYDLRGQLVSLGHFDAAGTLLGVEISGVFAWFVWRTVYLFKFISWSKRLKIAMDWTVNLFAPRDVTRA